MTKKEIINLTAGTEIIDVRYRYGVLADGSTDNATALMQMRTDLAGSGKPHYILQFPAGEIRYSNHRWLFGIERFTVEGNGSLFRSIYTGSDEIFQRPFFAGNIWFNNALAYVGTFTYITSHLINTVTAGSKTITCTTAGDSTIYTAGKRLLIWGYETGNGYPPKSMRKEWHEVESVNTGTGVITLRETLDRSYNSTIWDIPNVLGTNSAGKPRISLLDRADYTYPRWSEFKNLTFGAPTGGTNPSGTMQFPSEHLIVDNCKIEGHFWPTECKIADFKDIKVTASGLFASEFDRVVGIMNFERCYFNNSISNGGGIDEININDCKMAQSGGANARILNIKNTSIRADSFPTTSAPSLEQSPASNAQRRITIEGLNFSSSSSSNTGVAHIELARFLSYTIAVVSGTNIIIPFISFADANSTNIPFTTEEGLTRLFKEDGTKGGTVTSVTFDPTYNSNQGAFVVAGTWAAPVAAEVWRWSPVAEVIDNGNHKVSDLKRLWEGQSIRWAGNKTGKGQIHTMRLNQNDIRWDNTTGIIVSLYGKVIDIEVIVGKIWTGSDSTLRFDVLDASSNNLIRVSTILSGRRFVSKYFAHGSQTGDLVTSSESARMETWYKTLSLVVWTTGFAAPTDQTIAARPELDITIRWTEF